MKNMEYEISRNHGAFGEARLKEDIPSDAWMAEKVRYAKESGVNGFGVPKSFGPVTGSFSRPLMLPVSLLAKVKGERGEQENRRQDSLNYIRSFIEENAKLPSGPPFLVVDPFGTPWFNEGNHRVMVSEEMGVRHIPVEVRYFSGSQRATKDWSPSALLSQDASIQSELESLALMKKEVCRQTKAKSVPD